MDEVHEGDEGRIGWTTPDGAEASMQLVPRRQRQSRLDEVHEERQGAMHEVSHCQRQSWLSEVRCRGREEFLRGRNDAEAAHDNANAYNEDHNAEAYNNTKAYDDTKANTNNRRSTRYASSNEEARKAGSEAAPLSTCLQEVLQIRQCEKQGWLSNL
jgi:hypothetical protein